MIQVISTFWSLGLVAFGGPQAHIAILRDHLVIRRNWIQEEEFMELFAIGQVRTSVVFGFTYVCYDLEFLWVCVRGSVHHIMCPCIV